MSGEQSSKKIEEQHYLDGISYANLVSSIIYAIVCTRSDITYVISVVSEFMSNLGRAHWQALKWITRYLKGSLGIVLVYGGFRRSIEDVPIEGFVDSNFFRCFDTRKSLTCYVFNVYGTAISWNANL